MTTITLRSSNGETYTYKSNDLLGRGTYGTVFKCVRGSDSKAFALKLIPRYKLDEMKDYLYDALKRENSIQRIATDSRFPFFVGLYDDFSDESNMYMVLEKCDGTLKQFLKDSFKEKDCLHVVFQIGLGLAYLHARGFAHRDIKVDNIFILDGIAKIGDFGFASNLDKLTTNLGTPPYMSPEFYKDTEENYGPKVDVWALNTSLYYLLFRKFYFSPHDRAAMRRMVLNQPFVLPPDTPISQPVAKLLARGYQKDPEDRPSMVDYLYDTAFDEIRPKYKSFLKKIFSILGKPLPGEAPVFPEKVSPLPDHSAEKHKLLAQLLTFRNNLVNSYGKLLDFLEKHQVNRFLSLFIVKRHVQQLSLVLRAHLKGTGPIGLPLPNPQVSAQWPALANDPGFKNLINIFRNDLFKQKETYCRIYRSLFMIKQQSSFEMPSFDIDKHPGRPLLEALTALADAAPVAFQSDPEAAQIGQICRRILQFEISSPQTIFE